MDSYFTIVELLVVISIVGILVAILLPAVQAARESARRVQCGNQLRQLAIGCLNHESQHKHLPTGGWGTRWIGDPDMGFGKDQGGGWIYTVLPFIEQEPLLPWRRPPLIVPSGFAARSQRSIARRGVWQPLGRRS